MVPILLSEGWALLYVPVMAVTYSEIQAMSDADVISAYDRTAYHAAEPLSFFLDELRRRDQTRSNRLVVRLTYANTALAAIAVVVAVMSLLLR